jgi:hypothetical protein
VDRPQNENLVAFALLVLLYSLYRLWRMIGIFHRHSVSASWKLTTGKVCDRKIAELHEFDGDGWWYWYRPEITYNYTVMGEEFKNTFSAGSHSLVRTCAEKTLAEFGDTLGVFNNPEKPEESIPSREKVSRMDGIAIFVFLPISLLVLWFALINP